MGKIYQVIVIGIRGEKVMIDLCYTDEQMRSMTVRQLKEKAAQRLRSAAVENLRMIFIDQELEDDSSFLYEYGINHASHIHVVLKVPGGSGGVAKGNGLMGDKRGKNRSKEVLVWM